MIYPSEWDLTRPIYIENSPFLFHYTTYSSALGILISQQMRMGSLAKMNDPLEFEDHGKEGFVSHGDPSKEEFFAMARDFYNAVEEKENAVRLACFSMDLPRTDQENAYNNLSKGWAHSRMWAQYADGHEGICLIFDKSNLIKAFENSFKTTSCKTYCREITYSNDLYSIQDELSKPCDSFLTQDKIDFLFKKCADYRDEREFRLLLVDKDLKNPTESVSFPVKKSLCGVITGAKFPKENRETLQRAIKHCNPKIKSFYISWYYGMPDVTDPEYRKLWAKKILGE